MMKQNSRLKNEDGSVLVVALIILVVLTLLGIAVTTTTEIETQIAGNEKVHKMSFYNAEAAAMQCAQDLEIAVMSENLPVWVKLDKTYTPSRTDFGGFEEADLELDQNPSYTAVYEGPADTGESLDMTKGKIHEFSIYGCTDRNNSVSMIKLGFRKAY